MTGTFDALAELGLTAGRMSEAHYDHLTDSIASGALTEEDAVATVSELLRRTPAAEDAHGASPGADALYEGPSAQRREVQTTFDARFRASVELHGLLIHQEPGTFDDGFDGLDTGCTVWDAARATAEQLLAGRRPLARLVAGKRVVELGSGTGLAGLACAAAGASHVTLTDLPCRLPLLRRNVRANGWLATLGGCGLACSALDWGSDDLPARLSALGDFDVLVGTDLVYEEEHSAAVARLLAHALRQRPAAQLLWAQEEHNPIAVAALRHSLTRELQLQLVTAARFGYHGAIVIASVASVADAPTKTLPTL
mmetsp:Transcript_26381/g.84546  ORF Transcript_26381/g.84546 Transcript_26381/m.84546 type:complete len:311 (+) Transcript_26381:202-1134(+)